jgi:hypothetical protein
VTDKTKEFGFTCDVLFANFFELFSRMHYLLAENNSNALVIII